MQTSTPASPQRLERSRAALHPADAQARVEWVDAAKGIGIVLVVFGHAVGGMVAAGLFGADSAWADAYYLVYTFHMPMFLVLAGLFVRERVARDGAGFVRSALVRIAWPYLLWSTVQLLVIAALGGLVNTPTAFDPWRLASVLWEPPSQFWFLQALLVLHLASRWVLPRWGVGPLLLVTLAARLVVDWVELPLLAEMLARFGMFYALGVAGGARMRHTLAHWPSQRLVALAASAAVVWAIAASAPMLAGLSHWSLAAVPAALAGSAAVIAASALPGVAQAGLWVQLGRASMAIYLLHVLFVAGTRIVLTRLVGIDDTVLILLLACAAGIGGPLLVRALVLRAGATRALGLG